MSPDLESHLRERIREGKKPRDVIASMVTAGSIQHPKQAWRTLEKWIRRGEYEYGVCLDLGWLTTDTPAPPHCWGPHPPATPPPRR